MLESKQTNEQLKRLHAINKASERIARILVICNPKGKNSNANLTKKANKQGGRKQLCKLAKEIEKKFKECMQLRLQ